MIHERPKIDVSAEAEKIRLVDLYQSRNSIYLNPKKFTLIVIIQQHDDAIIKSPLLVSLKKEMKIYGVVIPNRPEYEALDCSAFFELFFGETRLGTYEYNLINLYKIVCIVVYDLEEAKSYFEVDKIFDESALAEFEFLREYFSPAELERLINAYLTDEDQMSRIFEAYLKTREKAKLIKRLFSFLKNRFVSPAITPVHTERMKNKGQNADAELSLNFTTSKDHHSHSDAENSEELSKESLAPKDPPLIRGFLNLSSLGKLERYSDLNDRIKEYLNLEPGTDIQRESQKNLSTLIESLLMKLNPSITEEKLKRIKDIDPPSEILTSFAFEYNLEKLLNELGMSHPLNGPSERYLSSFDDKNALRFDVKASPVQAFSYSIPRRVMSPLSNNNRMKLRKKLRSGEFAKERSLRKIKVSQSKKNPVFNQVGEDDGNLNLEEELDSALEKESYHSSISSLNSQKFGMFGRREFYDALAEKFREMLEDPLELLRKAIKDVIPEKRHKLLDVRYKESDMGLLEKLLEISYGYDEDDEIEVDDELQQILEEAASERMIDEKEKGPDSRNKHQVASNKRFVKSVIRADIGNRYSGRAFDIEEGEYLENLAVEGDQDLLGIYESYAVRQDSVDLLENLNVLLSYRKFSSPVLKGKHGTHVRNARKTKKKREPENEHVSAIPSCSAAHAATTTRACRRLKQHQRQAWHLRSLQTAFKQLQRTRQLAMWLQVHTRQVEDNESDRVLERANIG